MDELRRMKAALQPAEILLVVDAMTGQDAVNAASQFDQALDLTGFILTKLDGDARGGAALSIRAVTGKPIKFAGIGERLDAIEVFHPERMASRILGMGDVLTLIEKAEATFSEEQAAALERKLRRAEFDLNDFMEQLQHLKRMGPLDQVLEMIPGMARLRGRMPMEVDPAALVKTQAIIQSMTPQERADPDLIDGRRRRRIAQGSGTSRQDVNALLAQFKQMKQMFRRATEMEKAGKKFRIELPIR
jgi:signal recognition particle subunit SRP54